MLKTLGRSVSSHVKYSAVVTVVLWCTQFSSSAENQACNIGDNSVFEPASHTIPVFSVTDITKMSKTVTQKVLSVEQDEGVGARVRRSVGRHELRNLDPFLMLDEFRGTSPAGFPDHPHRGFETVSYLLKGQFQHEDFVGNKGILNPGDLQWMTAGKGIVHCEMPYGKEEAHGLQLWVNLSKKYKMVDPAYQELLDKDIPKTTKDGVTVKVIAGESYGIKGRQQEVGPHHTVVLSREGSAVEVTNKGDKLLRFVLIGGQPLNEPIVQYGPFVMNTRQEINEAMSDYSHGKNGFEHARQWESQYVKQKG